VVEQTMPNLDPINVQVTAGTNQNHFDLDRIGFAPGAPVTWL
jgi:hypothetical protein